jgi:predicted O-methyltransferase YrrM
MVHLLERIDTYVGVEIKVGPAAATLERMIAAGEPPFDFVFIDADKPGYGAYLDQSLRLSHPGTVIVADTVIRNGAVLEAAPADENARAMREFNARLAADPRLDAIIVPMLKRDVDGLAIAVVKGEGA